MKKILTVIVIIVGVSLIAYFGFIKSNQSTPIYPQQTNQTRTEEYSPTINPENFVPIINNPLYTLIPGTSFVYQSQTKDGTEKNITMVTNKTKTILGINAIEVWDRVWLNDSLIEETYDWYAQDKEGNVWYLGEDSKKYENGKIISTKGSWEAGVNNAKPGIIMKANPHIGDSYRQEYYKGEAEDMADIVSLGEKVTVPYGTFTDCLKTRDWSRIDPGANEYKYYCAKTGGMTLELNIGSGEKTELVHIDKTQK